MRFYPLDVCGSHSTGSILVRSVVPPPKLSSVRLDEEDPIVVELVGSLFAVVVVFSKLSGFNVSVPNGFENNSLHNGFPMDKHDALSSPSRQNASISSSLQMDTSAGQPAPSQQLHLSKATTP